MKHLNIIVRAFILLAFVTASLPLPMFEDAHFDGTIDLRDAIAAMRQFEDSAVNPEKFAETVKTAVSTMEVAADLKTVIKADRTTDISATSFSLTPVLLCSATWNLTAQMGFSNWRDTSESFISINQFPPTPPPKLA